MGYHVHMDARRARENSTNLPAAEWVEVPLTDADIAACAKAQAQLDRGEGVPGDVGLAMLDDLIAELEAKCRR